MLLQRFARPRLADARAMRDLAAPRHQSRRVRQAAAIDIFRREESRDAVKPLGIETVTHEMRTPSSMAAASASDAGSIARSAALGVSRRWWGENGRAECRERG